MKAYVSHKRVHADVITRIEFDPAGSGAAAVYMKDTPFRYCAAEMFARYKPVPGDYLVEYEDGYLSFSPKAAFEGGYSLIPKES